MKERLEMSPKWKAFLRLLTALLLFPILPVMALPTGKGGGAGGKEKDGDDGEEGDEGAGEDETESPDDEEDDEEDFDLERAMALIRKLRGAEKDLAKKLKETSKKVKDFETAEQERQRAELSELEQAKQDLDAAKARATELEESLLAARLAQAFYQEAERLEIVWANPQAREDALAVADLSGVVDDGQIDGKALKKVISGLKEERPYLLAQAGGRGPGTPPRERSKQTPAGGDDIPVLHIRL